MKKTLAVIWVLAGLFFVLAVHGGGGWQCAAAAMGSGFMAALNISEMLVEGDAA